MILGETTMNYDDQKLIVVGDRVLIHPDKDDEKTAHGLYLPQGVKEKEKIQSGTIVKVGPGHPIVDSQQLSMEIWDQEDKPKTPERYIPLQAKEGDTAVFLRSSAIDFKYHDIKYLIVPHSALLLLIRDPIHSAVQSLMKKNNEPS